jgi:transformation/transcription domain-associated protein
LQYILTIQDWDAMADTFWLMQGLDLILSTLAEEERIMLAPNSSLIPFFLPHRSRDEETSSRADQAQERRGHLIRFGGVGEATRQVLA